MDVYEVVRDRLVEFPGAFECFPFGAETAVFKVQAGEGRAAKVFALLWRSDGVMRLNVKCEPALAQQLRSAYVEVEPGYHMNKQHWNSVVLGSDWVSGASGLHLEQVHDMAEDSYDLVVASLPRNDRLLLGWRITE